MYSMHIFFEIKVIMFVTYINYCTSWFLMWNTELLYTSPKWCKVHIIKIRSGHVEWGICPNCMIHWENVRPTHKVNDTLSHEGMIQRRVEVYEPFISFETFVVAFLPLQSPNIFVSHVSFRTLKSARASAIGLAILSSISKLAAP